MGRRSLVKSTEKVFFIVVEEDERPSHWCVASRFLVSSILVVILLYSLSRFCICLFVYFLQIITIISVMTDVVNSQQTFVWLQERQTWNEWPTFCSQARATCSFYVRTVQKVVMFVDGCVLRRMLLSAVRRLSGDRVPAASSIRL